MLPQVGLKINQVYKLLYAWEHNNSPKCLSHYRKINVTSLIYILY